jgi:hypothetical protein
MSASCRALRRTIDDMSAPHEPLHGRDFTRLPEPVDLDDTVTSEDSVVVEPEKDDWQRENDWMIKTVG